MRLTEAVIALLAFAGSLQAGAITSGSLFFGDMQETAILSGTNFHATVNDYDFSPFPDGGFAPLSWIMPDIAFSAGYGSAGGGSEVTYNGIVYNPFGEPWLLSGQPYASTLYYRAVPTAPPTPVIGPGTYMVDLALELDFCLNDPKGVQILCETDTGTAMGTFTATDGGVGNSWVWLSGLNANVGPVFEQTIDSTVSTPEPSTLGCVGLAICCGLALRLRRRVV